MRDILALDNAWSVKQTFAGAHGSVTCFTVSIERISYKVLKLWSRVWTFYEKKIFVYSS